MIFHIGLSSNNMWWSKLGVKLNRLGLPDDLGNGFCGVPKNVRGDNCVDWDVGVEVQGGHLLSSLPNSWFSFLSSVDTVEIWLAASASGIDVERHKTNEPHLVQLQPDTVMLVRWTWKAGRCWKSTDSMVGFPRPVVKWGRRRRPPSYRA